MCSMIKIEFKQSPLIVRPEEPYQYLFLMEVHDGKTIGLARVLIPKLFKEYPRNPYLMN